MSGGTGNKYKVLVRGRGEGKGDYFSSALFLREPGRGGNELTGILTARGGKKKRVVI